MLVPANGNLTLLELVAHLHKQYYRYGIRLYLILYMIYMQQTIQFPPLELYTFTRRIIKRQIQSPKDWRHKFKKLSTSGKHW